MLKPLPTLIVRHRKENLKKCSLRGLESQEHFSFRRYPLTEPLGCEHFVLLSLDSDQYLSAEENYAGLLLFDATWRYAQKMESQIALPKTVVKRRLPDELQTAYPRCQHDCTEPGRGLASIEALAAAYAILGHPYHSLLDGYYWKEAFLEKNQKLFEKRSV